MLLKTLGDRRNPLLVDNKIGPCLWSRAFEIAEKVTDVWMVNKMSSVFGRNR